MKCSSCWVRFYSEWVDYSWLDQHPTTDAYRPLFYSIFSNYLLVLFPPRQTSACHAVLSFYKRLKLLASNIRAEKAGLAEWNQSLLDLHFHQVSYLWHWFSCWLTTILSKRCYRCHIESSLTVSLAVVNMPILCLFQLLIRVYIYLHSDALIDQYFVLVFTVSVLFRCCNELCSVILVHLSHWYLSFCCCTRPYHMLCDYSC